jgi:drug/metabolite transporter (DMT)-like permease
VDFSRPTAAHLLVFACSYAMVGISTALALDGGATPLTVVTLRSIGALLIFLAYFRVARIPFALSRRDRWIAFGIGIPLCVNTYCINAAIDEIPVPLAILIFYIWPAIVSAVTWASGAERFRWRAFWGLIFAFLGLVLALNVDMSAAQTRGVLLALISAFSWATVFLLMNTLFAGRDTRPVTLHIALFVAVVFVIASAVAGSVTLPVNRVGWAGIAGVTLFYAFATIGLFAATVQLGAMRTGFYMNFEPIATVLLSALILGQHLAPIQLLGAGLVLAALFPFRPPPRMAAALSPNARPGDGGAG